MQVTYYAVTGERVHVGHIDLCLDKSVPHITEYGGLATIDIDAKQKTVTFKQDGVSNAYSNVNFKVDRSFEDYEFTFKHLSHGGCEFTASKDFALNNITFVDYRPPESIQNDIKQRIETNGYNY